MAQRGMDDLARFAVAFGKLGADRRMAAFHLVVGRLADVVEQATPPTKRAGETDLLGHHAR